MLDAGGAARPVYGLAASVTVGDSNATGVLSAACSLRLCLLKTASAILSADRVADAPPGPAIFALDGEAAFVYFPQSQQLACWHAAQLDPMNLDVSGEILSMRAARGGLELAVRRDDGVWIVRANNEVIGSIPDATGPVMLLPDGVLFASQDSLVVRHLDGTEVRFDLPGAEAIFTLGDGYVEVRAGGSSFAVRIEPGREQLFHLPEASQ
jgi:hypothetical protein